MPPPKPSRTPEIGKTAIPGSASWTRMNNPIAGSGQRAAGSGQRAAGSGQRAAGSGQRAAGSGHDGSGPADRAVCRTVRNRTEPAARHPSVFAGDHRVRPVFTLVPGSDFSTDALAALAGAGARTIPWPQAVRGGHDLVVAASPNGPLHG